MNSKPHICYTQDQFQTLILMDQELTRLAALTLELHAQTTKQAYALSLRKEQASLFDKQEAHYQKIIDDLIEDHNAALKKRTLQAHRTKFKAGAIGTAIGLSLAIVLYSLTR